MKFHIVRSGETLENILFTYSLSKDELVENNKHIRNWNKLIPGSKIKIPTITKVIDQDIMEMEPFISEYYPHKNILEKERDEENAVISLVQDDSKPVSLVDNDVNNTQEMSDFVEKEENSQSELININNNQNIDKIENTNNNTDKNKDKYMNIDDFKINNRQEQESNITNKEINTNDKMTEKKEAKPLNKRKVKYYPYYYFNPYYGQYFLYYYPIYE